MPFIIHYHVSVSALHVALKSTPFGAPCRRKAHSEGIVELLFARITEKSVYKDGGFMAIRSVEALHDLADVRSGVLK